MGYCGTWAWFNKESEEYSRFYCGQALCHREKCQWLFWSHRVRLIASLIQEYGLIRFFTLTLDRGHIPAKIDAWFYIHHPWSKMRKRLKRLLPDFKFVAVLEHHKNKDFPHIHGFTNLWLSQAEWSELWDECKGGRIVWIEQVKNDQASEYVSKQIEVARYVGKENLCQAYKERRQQKTLWRSENTKAKFELTSNQNWCIIKESMYKENGDPTDWNSKKGVWAYGKDEQQRKDLETTCGSLSTKST